MDELLLVGGTLLLLLRPREGSRGSAPMIDGSLLLRRGGLLLVEGTVGDGGAARTLLGAARAPRSELAADEVKRLGRGTGGRLRPHATCELVNI